LFWENLYEFPVSKLNLDKEASIRKVNGGINNKLRFNILLKFSFPEGAISETLIIKNKSIINSGPKALNISVSSISNKLATFKDLESPLEKSLRQE